MAQYVFSFLTTSLFMALIIFAMLILGVLLPKAFSPKLRYAAWVFILLGLIIPFRPMLGNGLITFQMPYASATVENQGQTNEIGSTIAQSPIIGEAGQNINTYEAVGQNNLVAGQAISIMQVLVIAWAAVALAILTYHVWRYIGFKKLIKRWGVAVKDEQVLSVLQAIQAEKGIANKKIGLKRCDFISTSMIVGFLHPTILLPDRDFDADELELIFRHELIHYKRGDLYVKLLSVIAIALNWFNPAVYLMSAAMQADCEASCDEAVIADVGLESRQFYAEIIMDMIGSRKSNGTILSTCFYGSKGGIKKRMEAIMNASRGVKTIAFAALSALVLLIVFSGSIFAFSDQASQEQLFSQVPAYPAHNPEHPNDNAPSVEQVTSQRAREIATQFVGYGTAYDIRAFTEDGILNFEVEIRQGAMRYVVQINGETGSVISLNSYVEDDFAVQDSSEANVTGAPPELILQATTPEPTPQPAQEPTPQASPSPSPTASPSPTSSPSPSPSPTASPSPSPTTSPSHGNEHGHSSGQHSGGQGQGSGRNNRPSNPAISLDRAIEIAYADLANRSINATFHRDSGMDWERGQWVWELEFRTQGERMPIIEFYINVDNGNIVKFEWDD